MPTRPSCALARRTSLQSHLGASPRLFAYLGTAALVLLVYRRRFFDLVARHIPQVRRYGGQATIVLMDLDHFKRINDTHGHASGDLVLKAFGKLLAASVRDTDLAARIANDFAQGILDQSTAGQRDRADQNEPPGQPCPPFGRRWMSGSRYTLAISSELTAYPPVHSRNTITAAMEPR